MCLRFYCSLCMANKFVGEISGGRLHALMSFIEFGIIVDVVDVLVGRLRRRAMHSMFSETLKKFKVKI